MSPDDIELAPAPGMKRSERTEVMIQRAKELAAQGRHYQTIELLLVMEGFAEATELLSQALIGELRRTAEAARKERAQPGGQPQVPDGSHDVSTTLRNFCADLFALTVVALGRADAFPPLEAAQRSLIRGTLPPGPH